MVLGLTLVLATSGCRKTPVGVTNLPDRTIRNATPLRNGGSENPGPVIPAEPGVTGNPTFDPTAHPQPTGPWDQYAHDREPLKAQAIHFDLDSATIKSSEKSKLEAVADYMKSNAGKLLEIEGHCDERGTEGYNRSLGERRALAAREALIAAGISGDRMKTISYGESRPADAGHDESAWKQNRRDEFVVVSP